MPRADSPPGGARAERFVFDVEVGAPLIGRLTRYRGWLKRAA